MAQQNIDFGSFPNDPAADPIRAAFQKAQNNFTELYQTTLSTGVIEVVTGAGLAQNRTTGNITISANISNIRLSTGSSNSLVFGTSTTPTAKTVTTVSSITPIYIDLAPTITTSNATFTSSLSTANFAVSGFVNTSLLPGQHEVYNLGSPSRRWKDLFLSGNSLSLGAVTLNEVNGALVVPNVTVSGNVAAGNITAGYVSGNLTTAAQPNITSVGTLAQLEVAGAATANSMTVTGAFSAGTITGNVVLPPGATLTAPGSNMQIMFNDSGDAAAVSGMMFDKANTLLTIQGNITSGNISTTGNASISGNAVITGNIGVNKVVASGNVEGNNIITLGVVSTQAGITTGANLLITGITGTGSPSNLVTVTFATQTTIPFASGSTITISGVLPAGYNGTWAVVTGTDSSITFTSALNTTASFSGARIKGSGNTTINGVLEVVGNTSFGNITAVDSITGNTITLTGNVDSGNLIASGLIRVTGTANLGAVFSPGDANVQNSIVRGSFGASGAAVFGGTVRANADASFYGQLLANANMTVNGVFNASTANIANFKITSGGNVDGSVFTATLFSGNGANISFINASNVSGTVSSAASASTAGTADLANNIRQGSYSNITGVGTLTSLTVGGFTTNDDASVGGYLKMSVNNAVGANGATQSTSTQLAKTINVITSVTGGTGVRLPAAAAGQVIYIINDVNASIVVFPVSGQYIDSLAQNAGFTVGAYGRMTFVATSTSKYYTITSIYA